MKRMQARGLVAMVAAGGLLLAGCSGGGKVVGGGAGGTGGKVVDRGTLTFAVPQDPGNLDPQHTVLQIDDFFADRRPR